MQKVALFGEAERGKYHIPYICRSLGELVENLGSPPQDSEGLYYAVQVLLYEWDLVFFRVREEGFSQQDYLKGIKKLEKEPYVSAIYMPGVGDQAIIDATTPICEKHKISLIMNEKDLYDYLTYN